jgi:hypothetical protein
MAMPEVTNSPSGEKIKIRIIMNIPEPGALAFHED